MADVAYALEASTDTHGFLQLTMCVKVAYKTFFYLLIFLTKFEIQKKTQNFCAEGMTEGCDVETTPGRSAALNTFGVRVTQFKNKSTLLEIKYQ